MTKQASSNRSAKKRSKWRSGEPGPKGAGRDTRVDPAHVVVREESVPESSVAVEAPETNDESPDREEWERSLQRQADQLADHLRERRRELDLRESKLNAELALLENDSRRARLWLAGREAELDEMRQTLQKQQETLDAEARRLTEEASKPAPQHVERERNLNARQAELEAREVRLRAWESEIAASNEEIKALRAELEEDLRAGARTLADQRTAFDEQCTAVLEELTEARRRAEEKSRKADQARAALEAVRAEAQAMQRDSLQERIAAEELRIAVAETAPPATLVETLAALEAKLDRRYADAEADLAKKGAELDEIREDLSEHLELVFREKHRFEVYVNEQRRDLEEQTSRLAARERELEKRRGDMAKKARDWRSERFEYRETIRRLKRELLRKE